MFRGDGACQFAFGNQLAGIAIDRDIPDMLAPPNVDGFAGGGDKAFFDGAEMVCGDDGADGVFLIQINAHQGGKAPGSLGQNAGRAAVQYAVNLVRAFIDGQPRLQKIWPDLNKLKTQMVENIVGCDQSFNLGNRVGFEPDHKRHATICGI